MTRRHHLKVSSFLVIFVISQLLLISLLSSPPSSSSNSATIFVNSQETGTNVGGSSSAFDFSKIKKFANLKQFEQWVQHQQDVLVQVRVTNCPPCQTVDQALLGVLEATGGKTVVASIDIEKMKGFGKKYAKVLLKSQPSYPSDKAPVLMVFRYGYASPYAGPREFKGLISYFQTPHFVTKFQTVQSKQDFLSDLSIKIVGYFFHDRTKEYQLFEKVSHILLDSAKFGATFNEKIAKSLGLRNVNQLALIKPMESKIYFREKRFGLNEMIAFFEKNKGQIVIRMRPDNVLQILSTYQTIVIGFVDSADSTATQDILQNLKSIALDYASEKEIVFSFAEMNGMEPFLQQIGVSDMNAPILVIMQPQKKKNYVFDKSKMNILSESSLRDWIRDFKGGNLQNVIKSETIANEQENQKRLVRVLTYNNFDRNVRYYTPRSPESNSGERKHQITLVKFYQPHCPHCVALEPVYQSIAEEFQNDNHVVIAKMDISKNDTPDYVDVKHVPTLLLFKKCSVTDEAPVQQVLYSGDRSFKDIITFVRNNQCD